jgi:hypothetical protein
MPNPYSLDIIYGELRNTDGLKVIVNNNAEEHALRRIIITINIYYTKNNNNIFRASVEFFNANNRIDDITNIVQDKRFWSLIQYYQKEIIYAVSKEPSLLNDVKIAQEAGEKVQEIADLRADVAKGVFPRLAPKINKTLTIDFVLGLKYIIQGLNIYTSCRGYNHEEITIGRTFVGANAHRNLTLFDRKFAGPLLYLHLANVILANQLFFKPTRDLITGIQKAISYVRRRALPYSGIVAAVHGFALYYITGSPGLFSLFYDESQFWNLLNIVILPLIWPITAFFLRTYGSKIVTIIVKRSINRILKS